MRKRTPPRRRTRTSNASRTDAARPRQYAEILSRLGGIELQVRRNKLDSTRLDALEMQLSRLRVDFDIQLVRIAQIQAQLDTLRTTPGAADIAAALPLGPVVES